MIHKAEDASRMQAIAGLKREARICDIFMMKFAGISFDTLMSYINYSTMDIMF